MKNLLSKILPIMLLAVLACTDENTPSMHTQNKENSERYRFILQTSEPNTRVKDTDNVTAFQESDQIGVFAFINESGSHVTNVVKTINGVQELVAPEGQPEQTIPNPKINSYYIFYYPQNAQAIINKTQKNISNFTASDFTSFNFQISDDQSTLEGYRKSDLLWCYMNKDWLNQKDKTQKVTMHHLLAKIVVKISDANITKVEVSSQSIATGIKFISQSPGNMNYEQETKDNTILYKNGKTENPSIQSVIPAWIKSTNFEIIINGSVSYKPSNTFYFKDGYCYTFTIPEATPKPATRSGESAEFLLEPPVVTKMEPEVMDVNTLKTLMNK